MQYHYNYMSLIRSHIIPGNRIIADTEYTADLAASCSSSFELTSFLEVAFPYILDNYNCIIILMYQMHNRDPWVATSLQTEGILLNYHKIKCGQIKWKQ